MILPIEVTAQDVVLRARETGQEMTLREAEEWLADYMENMRIVLQRHIDDALRDLLEENKDVG